MINGFPPAGNDKSVILALLSCECVDEMDSQSKLKTGQKLTVGCPVTYQIEVHGYLDARWSDWFNDMTITPVADAQGTSITRLSGTVADQAALHGMLRKLYDLGLPLLTIRSLGRDQSEGHGRDVTVT
jgi:hypothetical protein